MAKGWNVPERGEVGLGSWRDGPREDSGAVTPGWGGWGPLTGKIRDALGYPRPLSFRGGWW